MTAIAADLGSRSAAAATPRTAGGLGWVLVVWLLAVPLPLGCAGPTTRGIWLVGCGILAVGFAGYADLQRLPRTLVWLGLLLLVPVLQLAVPAVATAPWPESNRSVLTLLPIRTALRGAEWLALWLLAVCASVGLRTSTQARLGLSTLALGSIAFVVHGLLLQRGAIPPLSSEQTQTVMVGTFVNRNHFANLLAMVAVLGVGLLGVAHQRRSPPALWLALGAAVLTASLGVIASASRGGLLALGGGMAVCLWLGGRWNRTQRVILVVGSLVAAATTAWLLPTELWQRFLQVGTELQGGGSRLDIWRGALALWSFFPWFGCGLGTFGDLSPATQSPLVPGRIENVHSDVLELFVETGWVGGLLVAGSLAVVAARVTQRTLACRDGGRRWLAASCCAALVAFVAHACVEFPLAIPANAAWAAALFGVLVGLQPNVAPPWAPRTARWFRLSMAAAGCVLCGFGIDRALHHADRDGLGEVAAAERQLAAQPHAAGSHVAAALRINPFAPNAQRVAALEALTRADVEHARQALAASLRWTNAAQRDERHVDLALDCLHMGAAELAAELLGAVLPRQGEAARRTALMRLHEALPVAEALASLLPDDGAVHASFAEVLLQRRDFAGREAVLALRRGGKPALLTIRDDARLCGVDVSQSRSEAAGTTATIDLHFELEVNAQRVPLVLRCDGPGAAIYRSFDATPAGYQYVARFDPAFPPGEYTLALDFRPDAPHFPFAKVVIPATPLRLTPVPTRAGCCYWTTASPGRRIHPEDGLPLRAGDVVWRDVQLPEVHSDLIVRTRTPTRLGAWFAGSQLTPALDAPTVVHRFRLPHASSGRIELRASGGDEPLLLDVAAMPRSSR